MLKSIALFAFTTGLACAADFMTGQAARAVIGQGTFTENTSGNSTTRFGAFGGLAFANNTLFATESNRLGFTPDNNRVVVFPNIDQSLPAPDAEIPAYIARCPLCFGTASIVLGQPDFDTTSHGSGPSKMRLPTAVATDGVVLAVADTSNNRVLIWNSIPTTTGQPADVVVGQTNFTNVRPGLSATSLRGPQGVWIQNGMLFVADTFNNRVLIWRSIPRSNGQAADIVLGQPNFNTAPAINLLDLSVEASPNTMLSPTSVTSDGLHVFVTDLGFNRVLIWNSIPTTNQQAADVVVGQIDFVKNRSNASNDLCASNGTDANNNPTYPARCAATLNFPRFTLSDGTRLFIADGGNDRVLVFNQIPVQNGARADAILGQTDEFAATAVSSNDAQLVSASNQTPTPTSLAWDGQNLYVSDATDYRILVFTPATRLVTTSGVVNSASRAIYATGSIVIGGTIKENDTVTVTIDSVDYKYTVVASDTTDTVAKNLTSLISGTNEGGTPDPKVTAYEEDGRSTIILVAREPGTAGASFAISTKTSTSAAITATTSGSALSGAGNASALAPGALITVKAADGQTFLDHTVSVDPGTENLPLELEGIQVYVDGNRTPLLMVSPTEINTQVPWEQYGSTSGSLIVRIRHEDGSVTVSTAVAIDVHDAAPGIFACNPANYPDLCAPGGQEPRVAAAVHSSDFATGTISIDGGIQAGDVATISIEERQYSYTVVKDDTLAIVRDNLINLINANTDEKVTASAGGQFTRVRLTAKVPGPEGNGTPIAGSSSTATTNTQGVQISVNATNTVMCCASTAGSLVTKDNPAVPGETIILLATGLGLVNPEEAKNALITGVAYNGPSANTARVGVNATVAGATTNVISAGAKVGTVGIFEVAVELSAGLPDNPQTRLSISQFFQTSNTVTLPVGTNQVDR